MQIIVSSVIALFGAITGAPYAQDSSCENLLGNKIAIPYLSGEEFDKFLEKNIINYAMIGYKSSDLGMEEFGPNGQWIRYTDFGPFHGKYSASGNMLPTSQRNWQRYISTKHHESMKLLLCKINRSCQL